MRTSGSDDRTVTVLYLDVRERRREKKTYHLPHSTRVEKETARVTCVEDVEH